MPEAGSIRPCLFAHYASKCRPKVVAPSLVLWESLHEGAVYVACGPPLSALSVVYRHSEVPLQSQECIDLIAIPAEADAFQWLLAVDSHARRLDAFNGAEQ